MYTISRWSFIVLDIQYFSKSLLSVHIYCTQFPVEFSQFWIYNFSANPNIPYIYNVHKFPLNISDRGYSIFLLIQTFRAYNVHNFPFNFLNSRYSISLQIQTFHMYKLYTISRRIFAVLDIQIFCKSRHSVQIIHTISRSIYIVLDIQFLCKSRHSVHI